MNTHIRLYVFPFRDPFMGPATQVPYSTAPYRTVEHPIHGVSNRCGTDPMPAYLLQLRTQINGGPTSRSQDLGLCAWQHVALKIGLPTTCTVARPQTAVELALHIHLISIEHMQSTRPSPTTTSPDNPTHSIQSLNTWPRPRAPKHAPPSRFLPRKALQTSPLYLSSCIYITL